ncbi:hypothetical protein Acr_25g0003290 [Actinidia rufa]|uniref:Uncharacterized protein n=1 Tax=Actinidia rufa TaxID=165716 RepID=A0A7J0GYK4_9ERIC|nr:hypothetical protein Acr_25g0003290 [Actinidia rufa]
MIGFSLVGGWWHLDGWQSLEVEERVVHSYEREGGSVSEIEIEYHRAIAGERSYHWMTEVAVIHPYHGKYDMCSKVLGLLSNDPMPKVSQVGCLEPSILYQPGNLNNPSALPSKPQVLQ